MIIINIITIISYYIIVTTSAYQQLLHIFKFINIPFHILFFISLLWILLLYLYLCVLESMVIIVHSK